MRTIRLFAIFAAALNMVARGAEPGDGLLPGTKNLVQGNTKLALEVFGRLKRPQENLFFSPYSISACLGMTYFGARGETAAQMAQALHFDTNLVHLAMSFRQLEMEMKQSKLQEGVELVSANGIWSQQNHPFLPAFLETARETFQAKIAQTDFHTQFEPARIEINSWVEETTHKKISNLIPAGMLDPMTRVVLVNAIYFKGKWAQPFKKESTANAPFTLSHEQTVQVPLMSRTGRFKYAQIDHGQVLELPYENGHLSMFVILPADVDGLERLEASLTLTNLDLWASHSPEREVQVFLPKFTLSGQFLLSDILKQLGMKVPFTSQADFSGMNGIRDLFISTIIHKAFVEVNEEGTEAAAATGTAMRTTSLAIRPVFRADHPFLFLIRDTRSGSILFMGRVTNPSLP